MEKKTNRAAKPGDYYLVVEILLELDSDPNVIKKSMLQVGWHMQ